MTYGSIRNRRGDLVVGVLQLPPVRQFGLEQISYPLSWVILFPTNPPMSAGRIRAPRAPTGNRG